MTGFIATEVNVHVQGVETPKEEAKKEDKKEKKETKKEEK